MPFTHPSSVIVIAYSNDATTLLGVSPSAAAAAREFEFRPNQVVTDEPDSGLIVAFAASGWVEMAWHLYQWGDKLEVIAPAELLELVKGHQRGDVGVFP